MTTRASHSSCTQDSSKNVPLSSSHTSIAPLSIKLLDAEKKAQEESKTRWNSEENSLAKGTNTISAFAQLFLLPRYTTQWKTTDVISSALCNRKTLLLLWKFISRGRFFCCCACYAYRVLSFSIAIYITSFLSGCVCISHSLLSSKHFHFRFDVVPTFLALLILNAGADFSLLCRFYCFTFKLEMRSECTQSSIAFDKVGDFGINNDGRWD